MKKVALLGCKAKLRRGPCSNLQGSSPNLARDMRLLDSSVGEYGRGMRFRLLGSLSVSEQGRTVALGGPKQRLVLAHMLLRANQIVPADT